MNPRQIYLCPLPHKYNHPELQFDNRIFLSYEVLEELNFVNGQIVSVSCNAISEKYGFPVQLCMSDIQLTENNINFNAELKTIHTNTGLDIEEFFDATIKNRSNILSFTSSFLISRIVSYWANSGLSYSPPSILKAFYIHAYIRPIYYIPKAQFVTSSILNALCKELQIDFLLLPSRYSLLIESSGVTILSDLASILLKRLEGQFMIENEILSVSLDLSGDDQDIANFFQRNNLMQLYFSLQLCNQKFPFFPFSPTQQLKLFFRVISKSSQKNFTTPFLGRLFCKVNVVCECPLKQYFVKTPISLNENSLKLFSNTCFVISFIAHFSPCLSFQDCQQDAASKSAKVTLHCFSKDHYGYMEALFQLFQSSLGFYILNLSCVKYSVGDIDELFITLIRDVKTLLSRIYNRIFGMPILIFVYGFNTLFDAFVHIDENYQEKKANKINLVEKAKKFIQFIQNEINVYSFVNICFLSDVKNKFSSLAIIPEKDTFVWPLNRKVDDILKKWIFLNIVDTDTRFLNTFLNLTCDFSFSDIFYLCDKLNNHTNASLSERMITDAIKSLGCFLFLYIDIKESYPSIPFTISEIPKVYWEDIGGLENAKSKLIETFSNKITKNDLSYHRKGVLLHGPPGTGKTLLAKAVATEFSLRFLSIKGPELLDSYVGESEKNVRELFKKAKELAPSLIFFDELDALAPSRSSSTSGNSSGVMHRLVSQLLAEIDNIHVSVYLLGATNRPDLIDAALLRPGRFDISIEFGILHTNEGVYSVLKALTRNFHLEILGDDILSVLTSKIIFPRTGAELYAVCSSALLKSISRNICLAKESIISSNDSLMKCIQDQPELEFIILNGMIKEEDNSFTKPFVSLDDFITAAKELELYHE